MTLQQHNAGADTGFSKWGGGYRSDPQYAKRGGGGGGGGELYASGPVHWRIQRGGGGGVEMIFTINFNHIWTQQHHIW